MKILVADAEWDGDRQSKIHCVSCKLLGKEHPVQRFTGMSVFEEYIKDINPNKWVFHNGLTSDIKVLNKLTKLDILERNVIDTFVVSRLVNYKKFRTHSLKEIGEYLGVYKGDYNGGWDEYTPEMGEYCDGDVLVAEAVFNHYRKEIMDPRWADAMRLEHDTASLCYTIGKTGFQFDQIEAEDILSDIHEDIKVLEDSFKSTFSSKLIEVNRLLYKTTKDGRLYTTVLKAIEKYPKTEVVGHELVCYDYKEFNPGSPKDRIDVLWSAGWKPYDKTKGHNEALRRARRRGG